MGCRCAVHAPLAPEPYGKGPDVVAASDDDTDAEHSQVKEQAKVA